MKAHTTVAILLMCTMATGPFSASGQSTDEPRLVERKGGAASGGGGGGHGGGHGSGHGGKGTIVGGGGSANKNHTSDGGLPIGALQKHGTLAIGSSAVALALYFL